MTSDSDYLGSDFYKGETVYWNDRNGLGDCPWCSGQIVAIEGAYAWVMSGSGSGAIVLLDWLSLSKPENWMR